MKIRSFVWLLVLVPCLGLMLGQSKSADTGGLRPSSLADPYCGYDVRVDVTPALPTPNDVISVTASGEWPDACSPSYQSHQVIDHSIRFDAAVTAPPDAACALVITPWGFTIDVGTLSEGSYQLDLHIANHRFSQSPVLCAGRSLTVSRTWSRIYLPSIEVGIHE